MRNCHFLHCISSHLNTVLSNWSILDHNQCSKVWLIDSMMMTMNQMKQMIKMKSMKNIREIEIETKRMTKTKRMIETRRMMNIRLIVYKNAQIIQMIDKISKNEIEMIVWALTSFLNDECRNFLMMKIDEYKDFAVFVKFLMKNVLELLIEMKMKMIV